jgi:hypothetical protein
MVHKSGKLANYAINIQTAENIKKIVNEHNTYIISFVQRLFDWSNFARNIVMRAKFGGFQPYRDHGIVDLTECVPSFARRQIHDEWDTNRNCLLPFSTEVQSLQDIVKSQMHRYLGIFTLNCDGEITADYSSNMAIVHHLPFNEDLYKQDLSADFRRDREIQKLKKIANSCDLHSFRGLAMPYNMQSYTNGCHHTNWHTKLVYGISPHWKFILGTLPPSCTTSKSKTIRYLRYKLFRFNPEHTFHTKLFQKFPINNKCNKNGLTLRKTLSNVKKHDSPIKIHNDIMFKEQHLKKVNFINRMLTKKVIALTFEKGHLPWEDGTRRYIFLNVNDAIITKCQKLF